MVVSYQPSSYKDVHSSNCVTAVVIFTSWPTKPLFVVMSTKRIAALMQGRGAKIISMRLRNKVFLTDLQFWKRRLELRLLFNLRRCLRMKLKDNVTFQFVPEKNYANKMRLRFRCQS